MRMRWPAALLFAGDPLFVPETGGPGGPALYMTAGNLGHDDQTPLVAASCPGLEIFELR